VRRALFALVAGAAMIVATPAFAQETTPEGSEPPAVAPPAPYRSFRIGFEGGGFRQSMLGQPVTGYDLSGALGFDSVVPSGLVRGFALDLRLAYLRGSTLNGLDTRTIRVGPEGAVILFSRVRTGLGVHLGDSGFWRATDGSLADALVVGASAFVTVDVVQLGHHALYLALRGNVDLDSQAPATVSDVALTIGFRL
jgi:hypothetical protein